MINYNAHDIERYLNRQMNAAEMHAFERAMMDDPMLADAVDGYQSVIGKRNIDADLAELKTKLNPKKENGKVITGFFRPWMSVAATLVIVLTAVLFYRYQNQTPLTETVAVKEQKAKEPVTVPKETVVDSTTVAINETKPVQEISAAPKILPKKESKQVKDNAVSTEAKSDFAKSQAAAPPETDVATTIAPPAPSVAKLEKKR